MDVSNQDHFSKIKKDIMKELKSTGEGNTGYVTRRLPCISRW